jgi:hypothetical protein
MRLLAWTIILLVIGSFAAHATLGFGMGLVTSILLCFIALGVIILADRLDAM